VACPRGVQWANHHQFRCTARLLRQALLLPMRKLARKPMGAVQSFDRRGSALAEAQCLPRRRPRDIGRRTSHSGSAPSRSPMIETVSWPPKCATDSSGRRARDSRPAPAASASPLPDQAIRSQPARPRGLRNSGPQARPPQPWRSSCAKR